MATKDKPAAPAADAAAAAVPAKPVPVPFVAASESRFQNSVDFTFPTVSYIPVAGTPLEHLLQPEYWANIRALKAGCRVWVVAEDEAYYAELMVRRVGQGYAKMQLLRGGELDKPAADLPENAGYEIQFRGQIVKHRVVRLKDGHVLKQGLDTNEEALAWLRDHKRMLAA